MNQMRFGTADTDLRPRSNIYMMMVVLSIVLR